MSSIYLTAANAHLAGLAIGAHRATWTDDECPWCADGCAGHDRVLGCDACGVDWPCDDVRAFVEALLRLASSATCAFDVDLIESYARKLRGEGDRS